MDTTTTTAFPALVYTGNGYHSHLQNPATGRTFCGSEVAADMGNQGIECEPSCHRCLKHNYLRARAYARQQREATTDNVIRLY